MVVFFLTVFVEIN